MLLFGHEMILKYLPIYAGEPPALYPDRQRRLARTALHGRLLCKACSLIQSSGPIWTKSRCENYQIRKVIAFPLHCLLLRQVKKEILQSKIITCDAKSSKAIQNSPSFRTLMARSSLSLSDNESHSQDRSLQGPFHSPLPQGFRNLTRCRSPNI